MRLLKHGNDDDIFFVTKMLPVPTEDCKDELDEVLLERLISKQSLRALAEKGFVKDARLRLVL